MKLKRLAALIAALLFIALSIAILVLAVTGAPANYLMAALLCLVLVPVFFYAMNLISRVLTRDEEQNQNRKDES